MSVFQRRLGRTAVISVGLVMTLVALSGCRFAAIIRSSTPDVSTGQSEGNAWSRSPAVSGDGRYTVFISSASTLTPGDTNNGDDIFVRDNATRSVKRYTEGWVYSYSTPTITPDGSRIAYTIYRPEGTGHRTTLAVVNRAAATIAFTRDSASDSEYLINPSLSDNGQVVAFERYSSATTNRTISVATASTETTVPRTDGVQSGSVYSPDLNATGTSVVFDSPESNLVAGDTNASFDVFRWDVGGSVLLVSVAADGAAANSGSTYPRWVGTGLFGIVVFSSFASNLVAGDTNGHQDIFVAVAVSGVGYRTNTRVVGGNGDSSLPTSSDNGRYFSFISKATDLVAGDTNGAIDVFVVDTGAPPEGPRVWRASVAEYLAQADGESTWPQISGDGRWVTYQSDATNLVKPDTNASTDVFTSFAPRVSIKTVTPTALTRGTTTHIDIRGSGFNMYPTLTIEGAGATLSNIQVFTDYSITADVTLTTDAAANLTLDLTASGEPNVGPATNGTCACITTVG